MTRGMRAYHQRICRPTCSLEASDGREDFLELPPMLCFPDRTWAPNRSLQRTESFRLVACGHWASQTVHLALVMQVPRPLYSAEEDRMHLGYHHPIDLDISTGLCKRV